MTKDELRECLARAISGSPFPSRRSLVRADAVFAAIRDAGLAIVPKEPSHEQLAAMASSRAVDDEGEFDSLCDHIGYSGENKTRTVLRAAYRAMLSAGDLLGERGS